MRFKMCKIICVLKWLLLFALWTCSNSFQTALPELELTTEPSIGRGLLNSNTDSKDLKKIGDSNSGNLGVQQKAKKMLQNLLEDYDKRFRPDFDGPTTKVGVTMLVKSIASIKEIDMEFKVDFYLRQTWQDPRLIFPPDHDVEELGLAGEFIDQIWIPDTFFLNEKESYVHAATVPNRFIRLYANGTVKTSTRLTLTAECPMDLALYPMDHQICGIELQSYGYSTKNVEYYWDGGVKGLEITLNSATLPQFMIRGFRRTNHTHETSTGVYSTLTLELLLVRSITRHLTQVYLPSFLVVVISYSSLWMSRENPEPRMAVGVTAVLTLTAIYMATNASDPEITYLKAVDVYLAICFIGIFMTFMQSVVVTYLCKKGAKSMEGKGQEFGRTERVTKRGHDDGQAGYEAKDVEVDVVSTKTEGNPFGNYCTGGAKLDVIFRIIFPVVFALFHILYCIYYVSASQLDYVEGYWTPLVI